MDENEKKAIEDGFERLSDVLDVFLANLDKCADNAETVVSDMKARAAKSKKKDKK